MFGHFVNNCDLCAALPNSPVFGIVYRMSVRTSKNKRFTILIPTVLGLFLLGQNIFLQKTDPSARLSKVEENKVAYIENAFSNLTLTDLNGREILAKEGKESVVILNFWASWCKPCLEEFPSLVKLKEKYGDKIEIIAINSDSEKDFYKAEKILKKFAFNFPVVKDPESKVLEKFMVDIIPYSIVIKKGKLLEISRGQKDFMSEEFLESIL